MVGEVPVFCCTACTLRILCSVLVLRVYCAYFEFPTWFVFCFLYVFCVCFVCCLCVFCMLFVVYRQPCVPVFQLVFHHHHLSYVHQYLIPNTRITSPPPVHDMLALQHARHVQLDGQPETRDCWFPGYAWTIANCNACGYVRV